MLEKLIKGRYLSFKDPKPKLTYVDGTFVTQPKIALTIEQSTKEKLSVAKWSKRADDYVRDDQNQMVRVDQKQRVSQISAGANPAPDKVHRNFQWLGYYGGAVSQVAFDNLDVLSGNFSGCWMMVYRSGGGITYVCHVGTVDDATHAKTIAAKRAWNDYAQAHRLTIERGFNPARAWGNPKDRPAKIHGDGLGRIWGLVTADAMVSVYLYRGEQDWDRYRIAGLKEVRPSHINDLANI